MPELLNIALGKSRKETHWKNEEWTWEQLVQKLSITERTHETHKEYMGAAKPRQDEIKDVGGFVGGFVVSGRRKKGNILNRSLLTLDIDHCSKDSNPWESFTLLNDNAACIYSTHKHKPSSPRLRLVIPLAREVNCEEYVAISRYLAGEIDIELFDDTTFQPHRLMYWPSTAKDGAFYFEEQKGDFLDPDEVLSMYPDWRDTSSWPVSSRVNLAIEREAKKQGDPLEKPGLIGAFCQTYGMHELLEKFLSASYTPCDIENRYTYTRGSTAAGMIVYDDKFAFSHHESDPAGGQLCNAFDLLRLHKFGLKDEDVNPRTNHTKLPSYLATLDLVAKDKKVIKLLGRQKLEAAREDFAEGFITEEEETNDDWLEKLDVDRKGNIHPTANNYLIILQNDTALKGLAYNEFANTKDVLKPLPWRDKKDLTPWRDSDNDNLFIYFEKAYELANAANLKRALKVAFEERKYHPIRDFLEGLKWDGEKRLDMLFIDYLGAEDNAYTRAATRKSLAAAVARIYVPGTKWDYAPILVGSQGIGKSVILQKIGMEDRGWFSDNFYLKGTKEDIEQLLGNWIIEMGELAGLSKRDVNEIKSYLSRREDQGRLAYSEEKSYFKRQCVFIGTTNNRNFLKDGTGNRRFWPIPVDSQKATRNIFEDLTVYEIEQLWAEAKYSYLKGEKLYLEAELQALAKEAQEEHSERDDRIGLVQEYLDTKLPENWENLGVYDRRNFLSEELSHKGTLERTQVSVVEIWCECFGKEKADLNRRTSNEITEILNALEGWGKAKKAVRIKHYGVQKIFERRVTKSVTNDVTM